MCGVVNLLKPPGMSSQAAVTKVRRLFDVKKAGHAGTLDPGACGVLLVCLGRATKLSPYLMGEQKEYIAELLVGVATDTLDTYGRLVATSDVRVRAEQIRAALPSFTGEIEQIAPDYSAVKVDGKPLYKYAREGRQVERVPRHVLVHEIELLENAAPDRFLFRIKCSKGTYVRCLLADIASNLGTVGCVSFLERTACGHFEADCAVTLDEIEESASKGCLDDLLIAPREAVLFPQIMLPNHLYDILLTGSSIDPAKVHGLTCTVGQAYRIYCRNEFFGIGELESGKLKLMARMKIQDPANLG